jgi:hypothetical protein
VTSIRELLDSKQRRRLVVPIQVTDPTEDQEAWVGAMQALTIARSKDDDEQRPDYMAQLSKQLDEAEARIKTHFANVELQSLPSAEWEAANAAWRDDEGDVNWAEALAPLLAASSVDEDLRDAEYWQELMSRDTWTEGDTDSLRAAILKLNVEAFDARVPKD